MKRSYTIFLIFISFILLLNVNAQCDYKIENKIKTDAANVKANYDVRMYVIDSTGAERPEISIDDVDPSGIYGYISEVNLNITNITDNIYIVLTDELGRTNTYTSDILIDKMVKYKVPDVSKIREYTIKIYSNQSCSLHEELRTIKIKTPMYNEYADTLACQDSDKYYCQRYVTTEININPEEIRIKL